MDLREQLSSHYRVRIAVVPLGSKPEACRDYIDEIKRNSVVEGSGMHFSPASDSPFKAWKSLKTRVHVQFFDSKLFNKSEWDEFHFHQKLFAVIGIVHCPTTPNLSMAYREFQDLKKVPKFSNAFRFRLYAFDEPVESKEEHALENLVMFPNQSIDHIRFYITANLSDLVSLLLKDFEKLASRMVKSKDNVLLTPADKAKHAEIIENKRLCLARRNKRVADLCLLAGTPSDAKKFYKDALEPARSSSDWIWAGGVIEGKAACLLREQGEEKAASNVIEWLNDAIACYSRVEIHGYPLKVFTGFKISLLCASLSKKDVMYKQKTRNALRVVTGIGEEGSAHEQIGIALEAAGIVAELGFSRIAAHYLYEASLIYHQLQQPTQVHYLLNILSEAFCMDISKYLKKAGGGLPMGDFDLPRGTVWTNDTKFPARHREAGWSDLGWERLHLSLLTSFISIPGHQANNGGTTDPLLLGSSFGQLLRSCKESLDQKTQSCLKQRLRILNRSMYPRKFSVKDIIQVVHIQPQALGADLKPHELVQEGNKEVFVYAPEGKGRNFRTKKKPKEVRLVAMEPFDIRITLCNPLTVSVDIQSIELLTSAPFKTFPASFCIPPMKDTYQVVISAYTTHPGKLTIEGVKLGLLEGEANYMVDDMGFGPLTLTQKEEGRFRFIERVCLRNIIVTPTLPRATLKVLDGRVCGRELFYGEQAVLWIEIENIGDIPIANLKLNIDMRFNSRSVEAQSLYYGASKRAKLTKDMKSMVSWEEKEMAGALPLSPRSKTKVPIYINGNPACCGIDIACRYADTKDAKFERCFQTNAEWVICSGISVKSIRISSVEPPSKPIWGPIENNSPSKGKDQDEKFEPQADLSPPSLLASTRRRTHKRPGPCSVDLTIVLQNSSAVDIAVAHHLDSKLKKRPPVVIPKMSTKTVVVPLQRISFGLENDLALIRLSQGDTSKSLDSVFGECVATFLGPQSIHWSVVGTPTPKPKGVLPLSANSNMLSPAMLRQVLIDPFVVKIKLSVDEDDDSILQKRGAYHICATESFITARVEVTSQYAKPTQPTNGQSEIEVERILPKMYEIKLVPEVVLGEDSIVVAGQTDTLLHVGSLVARHRYNTSFSHSVKVCFMHDGRYRLRSSCTALGEGSSLLILAQDELEVMVHEL